MRVALVSPYPTFPHTDELGCTKISHENNASWTVALAEALSQLPDTEVHVITEATDIPQSRTLTHRKVTLHYLKAPDQFKTLTFWFFDRRRLHRQLANIAPDIVHGQGIENQYGDAAVTAPYPNLLTIHGIPHLSNFAQKVSRFSRSRIVEITGNRCLQTARNLVIINPFVTEQLHLTPASHRLFSIPNPVAPQFFTAPTPAREPNLVLAIGWVDRLKAHDVFIRALALLKRRGHTVRAMIVGAIPKSDYAAALQQYVRTEQLAVEFIGFIPPEQVADLLRRCTVLVHPSRHENAPMSICEAMTCRTPVIAARVGGVPYLIRDGVSGLLFQSGNASELADKLQDLLENPATRDRLGAAAHLAAAQAHHPDVVAKLTRAAYATVLQSNSPKETHVRD